MFFPGVGGKRIGDRTGRQRQLLSYNLPCSSMELTELSTFAQWNQQHQYYKNALLPTVPVNTSVRDVICVVFLVCKMEPTKELPCIFETEDSPSFSDQHLEEQLGGGRRAPSPPPPLTQFRLRTVLTPSKRDAGLVRQAQARRGQLVDQVKRTDTEHLQPTSSASERPAVQEACASLLFADTTDELPSLFYAEDQEDNDLFGPHGDTAEKALPAVSDSAPPPAATGSLNIGLVHAASRGTSARPDGRPYPHVPPPPELLDLKRTLAVVTNELRLQATAAVGSSSTPSSVDVSEVVDNEITPRGRDPNIADLTATPFEISADFSLPERPETPTPSSRVQPGTLAASAAIYSDVPFAVGRTPAKVTSILDEGFNKIYQEFSNLAGQVDWPFQQVVQRFMKQFARTCASNQWNIYQTYNAAHKLEEQARLGDIDLTKLSQVEIVKRCYERFRESYPDTWQQILSMWADAESLAEADRTVAQRQALFLKLAKQHTQAFASMAKAHSFEAVLLMAGGVVNQDGGLGLVYATPGAVTFYQDCCSADDSDMLGHFKAHIYRTTSLAHPPKAQGAPPAEKEGPSKTQQTSEVERTSKVEPASKVARASKVEKTSKAEQMEYETEHADDGEKEDHAHLRQALAQALEKAGCTWASGKLFPWKGMPMKLARSGVVCFNYPDNVPFPGGPARSKAGSKGISELTLAECQTLIIALNDVAKSRLYFKHDPKLKDDLTHSRVPVINGAPPEADSPHLRGRRIFADLTYDRKGLERKHNAAATRIKKKARSSREVISIHDSDDNETRHKVKTNPRHAPPAPHPDSDSDGIEEISPSIVQKSVRIRHKSERALASSATKNSSSDLSSASGSEYHSQKRKQEVHDATEEPTNAPEWDGGEDTQPSSEEIDTALTRKRKSKSHHAKPPPKKRIVGGSVTHVPSRKAIGKAKAVDRAPMNVPSSRASSEELAVGGSTSQAISIQDDAPVVPSPLPSDVAAGNSVDCSSATTSTVFIPADAPRLQPTNPPAVQVTSAGRTMPQGVRPKPTLRTAATNSNATDDSVDPFSLRKRMWPAKTELATTVVVETEPLSAPSVNLLAAEEGRVQPPPDSVNPAHTPLPSSEPHEAQAENRTHAPASATQEMRLDALPQASVVGAPQSTQEFHPYQVPYRPQVFPLPHGFADGMAASGAGPSAAGAQGDVQATHSFPQDGGQGNPGHFMGGWFGHRGPDPRLQGYSGAFYPPYAHWAPYVEPDHNHGTAAPGFNGDPQFSNAYNPAAPYGYYYPGPSGQLRPPARIAQGGQEFKTNPAAKDSAVSEEASQMHQGSSGSN